MSKTLDTDLYQLMHEMGDHKVRRRVEELRQAGLFSNTGPGARMASDAGGLLCKALRDWKKTKRTNGHGKRVVQLLKDIPAERLTAVTIRFLINRISVMAERDLSLRSMRAGLGAKIQEEAEFLKFSQLDPVGYRFKEKDIAKGARKRAGIRQRFNERLRDNPDILDWDLQDRYMLSSLMIDLAITHCGIFTSTRKLVYKDNDKRAKGRMNQMVGFREEVFEWITEGINFLSECSPLYLPITQPPATWGPKQIGGYPESLVPNIHFMTTRSKEQRKALNKSECPDVYAALNTVQATPWAINRDTLAALRHVTEHNWPDPEILVRPPVEPVKPEKEFVKGDPDWLEYGRRKRKWHHVSEHYRLDKLRLAKSLSMGTLYEPFDKFYYPHQIDFRGRCYPIGSPIQYQGPDLQRGIIHFADAKPLGEGVGWFLIHGANCWGEDKVPFEDRFKWVQQHEEDIVRCGQDPLTHRLWTEADKPFQFLAFCKEFSEFVHEGETYRSRIPVCQDGSNNGLQIYSILLRDEVGGQATNCTPSDSPQDIYRDVAVLTTKKLEAIRDNPDSDLTHQRWAQRLLEFCGMSGTHGLPRSAVKRPVMTLPYGSTLYTCQRYLTEWYHDFVRGKNLSLDQQPFREKDVYNALNWVGSVVWEAIGDVVVKARDAMAWLREVADICAAEKVHCSWTTPLGLKVRQDYEKGTMKRLRLKAGGQIHLRLFEPNGEVNARKSRNGLCPNFVHSLDASVMLHTVNMAASRGVTHFQMIHDSFGTHAADAPIMAQSLREAFLDVFQHDWLEALRQELTTQLPEGVELPEPPSKGSLDINQLLQSKYFFA